MVNRLLDGIGLPDEFIIFAGGILLSILMTLVFKYAPNLTSSTKRIITILCGLFLSLLFVNYDFSDFISIQNTIVDSVTLIIANFAFYELVGHDKVNEWFNR